MMNIYPFVNLSNDSLSPTKSHGHMSCMSQSIDDLLPSASLSNNNLDFRDPPHLSYSQDSARNNPRTSTDHTMSMGNGAERSPPRLQNPQHETSQMDWSHESGPHSPVKAKRKRMRAPKNGEERLCGVCGEVAKSMHFGGMACDSCKAFFRRSVQANTYLSFKCPSSKKDCPIVKGNRRNCQYCRFQKCQSIGMQVDSVMPESDRITLWKNRLKRRQKTVSLTEESTSSSITSRVPSTDVAMVASSVREDSNQQMECQSVESVVDIAGPSFGLTKSEEDSIQYLLTIQELVFSSLPYPECCEGDTIEGISNLFYCICEKLRTFFNRLDDFHRVPKAEQTDILRSGISRSIYVHGAYMFDPVLMTWPSAHCKDYLRTPIISIDGLQRFTTYPELFNTMMAFYQTYGAEVDDEIILVLLCVIALFHNQNPSFLMNEIKNFHINLLNKHLVRRFGKEIAYYKTDKLLNILKDVVNIISFHTIVNITPTLDNSAKSCVAFSSFNKQLQAVFDVLEKAITGVSYPFASVYRMKSAVPDLEYFPYMNELKQMSSDNEYHPITSAIFGEATPTNQLLSLNLHGSLYERLKKRSGVENSPTDSPIDGESASSSTQIRPMYSLVGEAEKVNLTKFMEFLEYLSKSENSEVVRMLQATLPNFRARFNSNFS